MSDPASIGQDTPAVPGEAQNTAAAQINADTAQAQTDGADGGENVPAAQEKTFTQAELDDIVSRAKAKAEAKTERRVLRTVQQMIPQQREAAPAPVANTSEAPRREAFASDEEWLDARDDWRDRQRESKAAQERHADQSAKTVKTTEKLYAQAEKIPGFDRDDFDALPLTKSIVEALIESDQAPQLMAYLAGHPDDVSRIAGMSAVRQAAELGKIEAKLAEKPPVKTSKAPEPITPVGGGKTPVHDLASADMTTYMDMRKKQGARWAR